MNKNCGTCANYDRSSKQHTDVCGTCATGLEHGKRFGPTNWKPLPVTHADRIRAMSDEELAAAIWAVFNDSEYLVGQFCDGGAGCRLDNGDFDCNEAKEKCCILRWLRQTVKGE